MCGISAKKGWSTKEWIDCWTGISDKPGGVVVNHPCSASWVGACLDKASLSVPYGSCSDSKGGEKAKKVFWGECLLDSLDRKMLGRWKHMKLDYSGVRYAPVLISQFLHPWFLSVPPLLYSLRCEQRRQGRDARREELRRQLNICGTPVSYISGFVKANHCIF